MNSYPLILKFLFFQLFLISLVSCSENTNKSNSIDSAPPEKNRSLTKPPGSFSDTLIIDYPAAVFYNPDPVQLEKIKAVTDSTIFKSLLHECFYQMQYSRRALQQHWPNIKIIETDRARYILFKLKDGHEECIDLDTKNDFCGIFLFDGIKKSKLADMTNVESELGFYFSQ